MRNLVLVALGLSWFSLLAVFLEFFLTVGFFCSGEVSSSSICFISSPTVVAFEEAFSFLFLVEAFLEEFLTLLCGVALPFFLVSILGGVMDLVFRLLEDFLSEDFFREGFLEEDFLEEESSLRRVVVTLIEGLTLPADSIFSTAKVFLVLRGNHLGKGGWTPSLP